MLSAESFAGARALGEESLQMWDLNKRLEAYLARVKFLEEENEVLRAEIQSAKGSPAGEPWRARYDEELRALRDALDCAFREKCSAELARDNLYDEVQQVKSRCQKEQAAREEAKKLLSLSRKELEEERRAQIWLKERAVQLEKEVEALLEVHEEEKAGLDQELMSFSESLEGFRCAPVAFQPVEVQDYSKRLSDIWRGAVETYKTEVSQLEASLCQAKENLWKAVEDNQQNQLQLQHLEKELAGLRARKELLEESLAQQWQEQRGEAEKFQLAMEALDQEKQRLRVQIAQVLEDRQQLMHLKMSLSLEVATYRTLLEAESTRLQLPAGEYKLPNGFRDPKADLSSSRVAPVSAESRRLLPRDHPFVSTRAEGRGLQAKAPSDPPAAKNQSPGARELQKVNSGLQALQAAGTAREVGAPSHPQPSPSQPLSPDPPSPVPLEPGSPGGAGPAWLAGDVAVQSQGKENPSPAAGAEPPGAVPACSLRYPASLVSTALEDALKEMKVNTQPEEEPQDAPSPVATVELCGEGGEADGEQEPSEGAGDGKAPDVEETVGESMFQGLGVESGALWDRTTSPLGSRPHGTTGAELGVWPEKVPTELSPRDPEMGPQEGNTSSQEEPEQGQDKVEGPGMETSHLEEEEDEVEEDEEEVEEERSPCSPSVEDKGGFQGGGAAAQEAEAADAVPVGSCLALPTEGHLEEEVGGGDQERFEHQETLLCEMDPAAEEEQEQEICPEQETSRIREATPAEEVSLRAEETAVGDEDPDKAQDGEKERGEASEEVLGGKELQAREAVGAETPGKEVRVQEELGDLQEELWEQEKQELREEPWSREDDDSRKPHPEDWEVTAENTKGTEEPAWAEDTLTRAGGLESGVRHSSSPALLEETPGDDEDAERQGMSQQEPLLEAGQDQKLARDEQEDTMRQPALAPTDVLGQGGSQEPAQALQEPWEMLADAAEADKAEDAEADAAETEGAEAGEAEDAESDAAETEGAEAGEAEDAESDAAETEEAEDADNEETEAEAAEAEDADDELDSEPGQQESSSTGPTAPGQAPGDGADGGELEEEEEEDAGGSGELDLTPGTGRRVELEEILPDSTPLHLYEGQMLDVVASSQSPPEPEDGTETTPESQLAPEDGGWDRPLSATVPESREEEAGMEAATEAEGAEEEEGYFMVSALSHEVSSSEEAEISEDFEEIGKVEATEGSKDGLEAPGGASPVPEDQEPSEALAGEAGEDVELPTEEPSQRPKGENEDDAGGSTAELEEGSAVPEADPSPTGAMEGADGAASGMSEGPGYSEGLATRAAQELHGPEEPQNDAGRAETVAGGSLGLAGQEEEEEEDESGTAHEDTARLSPLAGLQDQVMPDFPEPSWDEQPSEAPDGDHLPPARDEEPPEADPPTLGFTAEAQGGCPEVVQKSPEVPELPTGVVQDSDILEIVEQALEFNQELVLGARVAEGGQQGPGETEDSSPASSSEEEPTVQEALGEPGAPRLEAAAGAQNGLRRDASLEDLAEFTEEVPNGIGSSLLLQETLTEETPAPAAPGDARLADAPACAKPGSADVAPISSALGGDDALLLAPQEPPACRLRAELEPWPLQDE